MHIVVLSALAMSVGWGFRGDYGHEAGAMVPGALLALAICLTARRPDWWERAPLLAILGAIGWAFGGQMSYGKIVGYTMHTSLPDVTYGFASLFTIGALWGGIGAGVLALGVTRSRRELDAFAWPLVVLYVVWKVLDLSGATRRLDQWNPYSDSDLIAATSALIVSAALGMANANWRRACMLIGLLAVGWLSSFYLLRGLCGLRMTPPRGDNWAGCVGLALALGIWHGMSRNRAAIMLMSYGLMAGGIGFAVGDFANVLGRTHWGPIGTIEALQKLDYWKWMEQLFGLIMGLGTALGFARLACGNASLLDNEKTKSPWSFWAPLFLLVAMPWENLWKNTRSWRRGGQIGDALFGIEAEWWFLVVGIALGLVVLRLVLRQAREPLPFVPESALGRAQLLFLVLLWVAVIGALLQVMPGLSRRGALFVHTTFWLTATACTWIVIGLDDRSCTIEKPGLDPEDATWLPGWRHGLLWACMPVLIGCLGYLAANAHEKPANGSHLRFEVEATALP